MSNLLKEFDKINIEICENNNCEEVNLSNEEKKEFERKFIRNKLYNGKIFCCAGYGIRNNELFLKCHKTKFFEFLIEKEKNKEFSKIFIGLNAVIEIDDKVILITRGPEVYSYKEYFDFPAGIMTYEENINERLLNRIEDELKIGKDNFEIVDFIPVAFLLDESINLFYKVKVKLSKEELEKIFISNFNNNPPRFIKKTYISDFINKNKVVFPEVLKYLYVK